MNEPLIDGFGRRHNNLRISVTDRCNIRCTYCMPENVEFLPKDNLLRFEEITRFATVASRMGIDKLRLTGGEPLVRNGLPVLIEMLGSIPGIRDIGLTTNGVLLGKLAEDLFASGLRRINISLDTLDPQRFQAITRRDLFDQVLDGIEAARRVGFHPIKLNAVAMAGVTDSEVVRLAHFCREKDLELRLIEFMPLEADRIWKRDKVLTAQDILALLADAGLPAVRSDNADPSAPASDYVYADGRGRLGIIASVSQPFCDRCNRIRLTADGKLRNCLFALDETDVKTPMRAGASDEQLAELIRESVAAKWAGHQINASDFVRPERTMHTIGG